MGVALKNLTARHIVMRFGQLLLLAVFIVLLAPTVARAETTKRFNTNIVVELDGSAQVTETIRHDFEGERKHGLYRDIPTVNQLPDKKYVYYTIDTKSVKRANSDEPFEVSKESTYTRIKIGDANITHSGVEEYEITYSVKPIMRRDPEGDYFNWNVIGQFWDFQIDSATATVTFNGITEPLKSERCYSGGYQSTAQDCTISVLNNTLSVASNGALSPQSGLTVNVLTPSDSYSAYLEPVDKAPDELSGPALWGAIAGVIFLLIIVPLAFFIIIGLYIRKAIIRKKRQSEQTIIAQYEPPDQLSPAELGMLSDDTADMVEITATLIDLAVRGYIRITQTEKKVLLFSSKSYTFTRLKTDANLRDYEMSLLEAIFDGQDEKRLKDIDKTNMASTIESIKKRLLASLKKKGFYAEKQKMLSADNITDEGYKAWARVEGFKLFLSVTEAERLKFSDAPDRNPKQFSKLLPYAVALGVEKQWADQFANMDISKETGWYVGPNNQVFTASLLASSLKNDFANSISAGFVPASSGSSGGGGFSGGGGGGGGGGSW
ncbi:DUF2207 domain-containing protein [Candidatus Saccharibacteria bacterium]|nr:DUF2207 domain-containing protein [Candidatus Saccharibacteria bacterium]